MFKPDLAGLWGKTEDISQEDGAKDCRRQPGRCETENEAKTQALPWSPLLGRAENMQRGNNRGYGFDISSDNNIFSLETEIRQRPVRCSNRRSQSLLRRLNRDFRNWRRHGSEFGRHAPIQTLRRQPLCRGILGTVYQKR